ncbi:crossover junction endodeoxyribonuclease RuvC [Solimonas terrae]|uniref:Crossover junction endodeoxyribonuclease RuvC n=1 Tax=Solimonas terrae TaxID=1396819 RepID=A0A6M2BQ67_9GAMM|nr:crossover junction endodeoxyribonuclease RuvC [Solimonas terrae]NGY04227.1 crossover junction endodeoxyribonuclease RuvC [Solimonas terrae]
MSIAAVRIIGIDPGSRHTGYGVIESERGRARMIAAGRISTASGTVPQRLLQIQRELAALLHEFTPAEAAIEEVFVNRNVQTALVLGQARGVALCALAQSGLDVAEYAPTQVKLALTGSGRAEKLQVQHMVKVLLNLQGAMAVDASDALAIALTHAQVRGMKARTDALAGGKRWGRA